MKKYRIPTAGYEVFADPAAALEYIRAQGKYPAVIKADGLAWQGVIIAQNEEEAKAALHSIMEDKDLWGRRRPCSGGGIPHRPGGVRAGLHRRQNPQAHGVLHGPQARLRWGQGPQHRGHGHHQPNPFYTDEVAQQCMETIFLPTVQAMNAEGRPFKGCLYFG